MIKRPTPLPIPVGGRYWSAEVPGLGVHWFRFPSFVEVHALRQLYATVPRINENIGARVYSVAEMIERSPHMGAWIGACWFHLEQGLVASMPAAKPGRAPDADALLAYGTAVVEDLTEAGYAFGDILALWLAVADGSNSRLEITDSAIRRASFSQPLGEAGTTSP